jgi:SAM-dependent methyltransferase
MTAAGPPGPSDGQDRMRAAVDEHLWHVALGVWHPSAVLKALRLYHPAQVGARPPPPTDAGLGAHFSGLHPGAVLSGEEAAGPERAPEPAHQADCVLASHAGIVFDEALEVVGPYLPPSSRLLHVGSGGHTGALDLAVAIPDGEVVALGSTAAATQELMVRAREAGIGNLAVFQGEPRRLPGRFAGQFDAVLLWFVYHHCPDPEQVAAELRRTLRPGGYALLVDPVQTPMTAPDWLAALADVGAVAFHQPGELERLFDGARFSLFHWEELLPGVGLVVAMA